MLPPKKVTFYQYSPALGYLTVNRLSYHTVCCIYIFKKAKVSEKVMVSLNLCFRLTLLEAHGAAAMADWFQHYKTAFNLSPSISPSMCNLWH